MAGLSSALNISVGSLLFNQTAMSTISHNLSNVNNKNYSRQEIQPSADFINGFGAGVNLDGIIRRVDEQLQAELTGQVSNRSYAQTAKRFMENVEIIFGQPNSGNSISDILSDVFAQFNNVAGLPESSSQRLNAINQIQFMSEQLNSMSSQMQNLQQTLDGEVDIRLTSINRAIERIHDLNIEISVTRNASMGGQNTNDLEDARQEQINILAEQLNINVIYDANNRAIVNSANGSQLVTSGGYSQLERTPAVAPSIFAGIGVRTIGASGNPANFVLPFDTEALTGGSLKALIDVRDTEVPNILDQINEFSRVTINSINEVHSRGVGVPPPSSLTSAQLTTPGVDLFAEIGLVPGSSFDVSLVDQTTGTPLNTTTVTLPGAPPLSTGDLVTTINTALAGAGFPPSVQASFAGGQLTVEDTASTGGIVMGNDTDDFLGKIVMNPLLDGTDAATIGVRDDVQAQPGLLATARMRAADGGLSFNNNANAVALTQLGSENKNFAAAGGLTPQIDTLEGYFGTITSNLAVNLQDNTRRLDFSEALENDLAERNASVSGVNSDEELANLITFQNSFQASSRVITTIDEMFDTLLNII